FKFKKGKKRNKTKGIQMRK
ncbi:apoptosis-stimulating of p53 protein 2, partial [Nephila pilipes]